VGDEARSDVALAIAALVFGPLLLGGLRGGSGTVGVLLDVGVVLALSALVPLLLVQSRGRTFTDAFGLGGASGPTGITAGLPIAVPVALAGAVAMLTAGAAPGAALLGRLSGAPLQALQVAALSVGAFVFVTFVVRRGAEAFTRSPEWPLRRLLRTLGMAAAVLALVAGLLRVPLGASPARVLVNALALAAVVLLADRMLGARQVAPRLAVMLPAGILLYLHVSAFGLSVGLQAGALAAGMVTVIGTLALSARGAWVTVPLVVAAHLWPTCLSPLALVRGLC
jgi:hypothetical protein